MKVVWNHSQSCAVQPIKKITSLLELLLNEESCGNTNSPFAQAGGIRAAFGQLARPVIQSLLIGHPIQKVSIVLANERLRVVRGIRRGLPDRIVVCNAQEG